jgi:hypothetical protein
VVPGLGAEAGAALTAHPGIGHISFTGSVATGRLVQKAAAQNVVPVTLELGGKSPQLVFADADLDAALPFLVNACIQNAGQTCSASSRILIERTRFDEVAERMADSYRGKMCGARADDRPRPRPPHLARQKEIVEGYLDLAGQGQRIAEGQIAPDAPETGHYVAPVLLAGVAPEDRLAQEEIFGPVQVLLPFDDEDHGVASPTARPTAWWQASGPATADARCGWPNGSARGRSSSTTTGRRGAWSCRSAAPASRATAAKRGSRRSTPSPASRPSRRITASVSLLGRPLIFRIFGKMKVGVHTSRHPVFRSSELGDRLAPHRYNETPDTRDPLRKTSHPRSAPRLRHFAAAVFGALHNQLSYSVGPTYFTALKFDQFAIPPDTAPRLGAALVGIQASWWMGPLIALPAFLLGFATVPRTETYLAAGIGAIGLVIVLATLAALMGLVGWHRGGSHRHPRHLSHLAGGSHARRFLPRGLHA